MNAHQEDDAGTMHELDHHECIAFLRRADVGRVGFVADGRPIVLPVNYAASTDGTVVFRTADGTSLSRIDGQTVAFEVDGFEARTHAGWSVCIAGTATELDDAARPIDERLRVRQLSTWAPGVRDRWFNISPDQVTGRRIPPPTDIDGWMAGVLS